MSERGDEALLRDIREAVRRIRVYSQAMTYERFLADTKTQDAVIRNLEIMGEATKGLSAALREGHPNIPWKGMAGVRDRLIHRYFGVNLDIVWEIVTIEVPFLESQIEAILQHHGRGQSPAPTA
ncbi:MAG: DUF86 domain-containing protein [Anaerolineae bacterium]|jgi:uncharacterized protein with HEPN domain